MVTCGTPFAGSAESSAPVFVPPAQHLCLAATLIVHPSLTSAKASPERFRASNTALKLLTTVNRIAGPVHAGFNSAFSFLSLRDRRGFGTSRRKKESEEDPERDAAEIINLELATTDSLWTRADDLWHAVAWAFNCSIAYPKRWARWKLWLKLMLDILEDDWKERERIDQEVINASDEAIDEQLAESSRADSLVIKYLPSHGNAHGGFRRAVRAIFADGSVRAQQEFRPIFDGETRAFRNGSRNKENSNVPVGRVNIDEGFYADYLDEEEAFLGEAEEDEKSNGAREQSSASTLPEAEKERHHRNGDMGTATGEGSTDGANVFGGMEAVALRIRLLAMVSRCNLILVIPCWQDPCKNATDTCLALRCIVLPTQIFDYDRVLVRYLSRSSSSTAIADIFPIFQPDNLPSDAGLGIFISFGPVAPFTHLLGRSKPIKYPFIIHSPRTKS